MRGEAQCRWCEIRLRFIADFNPSKSEVAHLSGDTEVSFLPMEAIGDDGSLQLDGRRALDAVQQGYTYFQDGDLVIAKITPCFENGKGALAEGLLNGIGFGTTELIVVRPHRDRVLGRYLHWLFSAPHFRDTATASMYGAGGQKRVPDDFVRDFRVALPSKGEQSAIATFLDHETAKIDALVAEQERLIALLKEKRQAVISHAVTKGLDPNAPMKDSGVEWLGQVPAHWRLMPIRAIYRFVKRQEKADLEVMSVYRDYGVIAKNSRSDNINKTPEDLSLYQTVKPFDVVVNKMKAWQGSLGVSSTLGITSPDYAVFEPTQEVVSGYLNWLLRCSLLPGTYRTISNGIRPDQWRLEPDKFRELRIPYPPLSEQQDIDKALAAAMVGYDSLTTEATRAIILLRERRAALISAAVTGKIDVRGFIRPEQQAA